MSQENDMVNILVFITQNQLMLKCCIHFKLILTQTRQYKKWNFLYSPPQPVSFTYVSEEKITINVMCIILAHACILEHIQIHNIVLLCFLVWTLPHHKYIFAALGCLCFHIHQCWFDFGLVHLFTLSLT